MTDLKYQSLGKKVMEDSSFEFIIRDVERGAFGLFHWRKRLAELLFRLGGRILRVGTIKVTVDDE